MNRSQWHIDSWERIPEDFTCKVTENLKDPCEIYNRNGKYIISLYPHISFNHAPGEVISCKNLFIVLFKRANFVEKKWEYIMILEEIKPIFE